MAGAGGAVYVTYGRRRGSAPVLRRRKAAIRAMNRFERLFGFRGEAKVKYLDGEFQVVSPGDYVLCAVTGEPMPLAELRYWSVELQEPYATAEASLRRHLETRRPSGAR